MTKVCCDASPQIGMTPDLAMSQVEYDATMQRILDMWTSLQGVSSDDARRAFMDIVDEWPYSMHSIFDIQVRRSSFETCVSPQHLPIVFLAINLPRLAKRHVVVDWTR